MRSKWDSMSTDELLALRDLMQEVLSEKLSARTTELERQLRTLDQLTAGVRPRLP
jgi:hypothetical protein